MTECEFCGGTENVFLNHYEYHVEPPRRINICRNCHLKLHIPNQMWDGSHSPLECILDSRNRLNLPVKITRNWGTPVILDVWTCAGAIYPSNVSLEDAVNSVEILIADMYHQLELQERNEGEIAKCGQCGSIKWISASKKSEESKEEK